MAQHLIPGAFLVEAPGEAAQEYHRKFQSLGFVDAHNGDGAGAALLGRGGDALFLQSLQIIQKLSQILMAVSLIVLCQPAEGLQVLRLPLLHGTVQAVHPGQGENILQELTHIVHSGLGPELSQQLQKRPAVLPLTFFHHPDKGGISVCLPNLGQVVRCEAKEGACQHRHQGDVLQRVVDGLQQRPEGGNLPGLKQILSVSGDTGDAQLLQSVLKLSPHGTGGPEKNHNILRADSPQGILLPDKVFLRQKLPDTPGGKGRLLPVGVCLHLDAVQLHLRLILRNMGNALVEPLPFPVGKAANFRGHTAAEHGVDSRYHLPGRAEIPGQKHLPTLARLGLLRRNKLVVFFQEDSRVCQTELVNGLLHISHHKAVLLLGGKGGEDGILHLVGVLVLVHHNLPEALSNLPGQGGGAAAVLAQEQIQHFML